MKRTETHPLIIHTRSGKMSLLVQSRNRAFLSGRVEDRKHRASVVFLFYVERCGEKDEWVPGPLYDEHVHGLKEQLEAFRDWAEAHPRLFEIAELVSNENEKFISEFKR